MEEEHRRQGLKDDVLREACQQRKAIGMYSTGYAQRIFPLILVSPVSGTRIVHDALGDGADGSLGKALERTRRSKHPPIRRCSHLRSSVLDEQVGGEHGLSSTAKIKRLKKRVISPFELNLPLPIGIFGVEHAIVGGLF